MLVLSFFVINSTGYAAIGTKLIIGDFTINSTPGSQSSGHSLPKQCDLYITLNTTVEVNQEIIAGKKVCYSVPETNESGSINAQPLEDFVQVRFDDQDNITFIYDGVGILHTLKNMTIFVSKKTSSDGKPVIVISTTPQALETPREIKITVLELNLQNEIINKHDVTQNELESMFFDKNAVNVLVQFEGSKKWNLYAKKDNGVELKISQYEEVNADIKVTSADITNTRVSLFGLIIGGIFYVQTFFKKDDALEINV